MVETQGAWISVGSGRLSYTPTEGQLDAFLHSAQDLRQALDPTVAFRDPATNDPCLAADLVLEGGGVKGIALAGAVLALDKAGYRFPRVAGTSAGAIAATLIAAIQNAKQPMEMLGTYLDQMTFAKFMEGGKLENLAGRLGRWLEDPVDAGELLHHLGLYSGDYLYEWLDPILTNLGATTFSALAIAVSDDPGMDAALKDEPDRRFKLVVHTSDITRGLLVRVPWDLADYGVQPGQFGIADAVRASMSIPFFFQPVRRASIKATVDVPQSDGTIATRQFEGGQVTWVDGGMLSNFPIGAFDRTDGRPPRWPTVGIKLSAQPFITPADVPVKSTAREALRCMHTMMNEWDRYSVQDADASRIIFINNGGIKATQFDLSPAQQQALFAAGANAAVNFVIAQAKVGGALRAQSSSPRSSSPAPATASRPEG
jgi:NTE family protein